MLFGKLLLSFDKVNFIDLTEAIMRKIKYEI